MNKEQIKQMQPGTPLNARVHKVLFGKTVREVWAPQYSTTWEGMKLVVDALKQRMYGLRIETSLTGKFVSIFNRFDLVAEAEGETEPHAVAIAAILACMDQNTEDEEQ